MNKQYYVTTPIYYVNASPHIGHAYTSVIADIIARYHRLEGKYVFFVTGTDEHGQKILRAAQKSYQTPQGFCDKISQNFQMLAHNLNLSHNYFIRTTQAQHIRTVQYIWNRLVDFGQIYLGKYQGWYAVNEETFYQADELYQTEQGQYLTPFGNVVEWLEQESYFFRLSYWEEALLDFYAKNTDFVTPNFYFNEVKAFVRSGLRDLSISRANCTWGIPVPKHPQHTIYVWFDALINYLSVTGYPDNSYAQIWPADIHVIGKDILKFHAVYWPALLLALEVELPQQILVHGWWQINNQKISKSLGNTVDPNVLVELYKVDPVRYYLVRQFIIGNDGNFTYESMIETINTDLVNTLGNLLHRILALLSKNFCGKIPFVNTSHIIQSWIQNIYAFVIKYQELMARYDFYHVLENLSKFAKSGNKYINDTMPWQCSNLDDMAQILVPALQAIVAIVIYLQPFIPQTSAQILDALQIPSTQRSLKHIAQSLIPGSLIQLDTIIFPRIIANKKL